MPPDRRGNSPAEVASRHAPSRHNTPPASPSLCAKPLGRRRATPSLPCRRRASPAAALRRCRASPFAVPDRTLCSTRRPRIAAVPARAPSSARKPSRGLSGKQRRAPSCPSSPGCCTWRPTPSWTRARAHQRPPPPGVGACTDGARGRFSRRGRLLTDAGGESHRDAVRGRRRTSRGRHGSGSRGR